MKTFAISLVSSVCVLAALAWPQTASAQIVFSTTFNCPDWNQTMGLLDANVCATGDGIAGSGGFSTSLGNVDQITAAANYPGGGGGKGFRHYRGNNGTGNNDNGGGLRIDLPSAYTEVWVRLYMRYQAGFHWTFSPDQHPAYTKDIYWHNGDLSRDWVFGYQSGGGLSGWGIFNGLTAQGSGHEWSATMGGVNASGDGLWHCFEFHANQAANKIDMWIDNVQYLNNKTLSFTHQTNPWQSFILGSNQNAVTDATGKTVSAGGTPTDWYTDYDDLAVSISGRIGCFVAPAAPVLTVH